MIDRYQALLRGEITGADLWRELKLQNQLGVTRGQMEREEARKVFPRRGAAPPRPIDRPMLIAFHKPYGVLTQFTPEAGSSLRTLADFGFPPRVYPLGRLDGDSEGLLLLSDEAELNARLLDPSAGHPRCYWVQVERIPTDESLRRLEAGLVIQGYRTLPCRAWRLEPAPDVGPRDPPIRVRKNVPDCWLGLELTEGKNRQVRRMTAAIGHPTLRLVRARIGGYELGALEPGRWVALDAAARRLVFRL